MANQIHSIFQNSCKIEAKLIGVSDFPPLLRTTKDIINAKTRFYGFFEEHCLAAVIELDISESHLDINSLTVAPSFFRKGIAGKLVDYALKSFDVDTARVETAVANLPAINLYEKYGFDEFKRWTPSHGIQKLAMSYKS